MAPSATGGMGKLARSCMATHARARVGCAYATARDLRYGRVMRRNVVQMTDGVSRSVPNMY